MYIIGRWALSIVAIDIRWVKNSKTKGSSFKLVDRVPYNDYPSGTATVELTRIKTK